MSDGSLWIDHESEILPITGHSSLATAQPHECMTVRREQRAEARGLASPSAAVPVPLPTQTGTGAQKKGGALNSM
jgi:hypothetical protein